jgi:aldehyde:ferredoxin oxidoreductase
MTYGYAGKILNIDLTSGKITRFSTMDYASKYLGGRGLASRIYWERVKPGISACDPDNLLILMNGTLVAAGAQAANRMIVVGKSPMAYPESYCYGNFGGFFPAELKKAGYDGIVFEGRSPKPVYIHIEDDLVELLDASALWGQGAYRTGELLQQIYGSSVKFFTTGVAGERMVRTSVTVASHHSTSTGGYGAVMGSKNLKAVVVRGTHKISVADPERLKELNRYALMIGKRNQLVIPPHILRSKHADQVKYTGRQGCYQCAMECAGGKYLYGGKLEGLRRCQSQEYYLPWEYNDHEDEPIETLFDAPTLANDYSLSTFELTDMLNWIYACYRAGIFTEEQTGLPLSKMGTREFLEKFLHSIAYREGFGDLLAEGIPRIKQKVSPEARALISPQAADIGQYDMISPRAFVYHGLLYSMEPRVHQALIHDTSYLYVNWVFNRTGVLPPSPVNSQVFHAAAKLFWGSEAAGDVSTYEGKALASKMTQDRTYIKDSLGLCDYAWPIMYSFNTFDYVGDPDLPYRMFTAVTGIPAEKIEEYAERIFNMQRIILLREGRKVPQADYPLEMNFTEPLGGDTPYRMVPGPGDEMVDTAGFILDRGKFKQMLKEYYRLRGWDEETGVPLKQTLIKLGLDDVSASFSPLE